jgi:hypothetical protein
MADTLQISVTVVGAENVATVTTQPGTSGAALPALTGPLFAFSQTYLPTITAFSARRYTFTPASYVFTIATAGARAMLVVDDPAFASNSGMQLSVIQGTTIYGAVNGGSGFSGGYSATPTPWPAMFTAPNGVTIQTESSPGTAAAPTVAFSATLYTW